MLQYAPNAPRSPWSGRSPTYGGLYTNPQCERTHMNNTSAVELKFSTYIRWCGLAAILGGVLLILAVAIFAFTHGTQSQAQNGTLFGFKSAQFAKVFQPTIWLSFCSGLLVSMPYRPDRQNNSGR